MKKIIFILFLFLSCYIIYNLTEKDNNNCLVLGDTIGDNQYLKESNLINSYNNYYVNKDYRIIDLINIIKYNEEITINEKNISIHQLLNKSDIIIVSIGMNDIYYKLNDNTKDIYTYVNNMVNNMEILLETIDKYNHEKVIVLGYYNITNKNNDIFTYLNYKIKRITKKRNYEYIELNNLITKNFLEKSDNFILNKQGYERINQIIVEIIKNY